MFAHDIPKEKISLYNHSFSDNIFITKKTCTFEFFHLHLHIVYFTHTKIVISTLLQTILSNFYQWTPVKQE